MKRLILSAILLGALAGAGCEVEPAPVGLEYDVGPDVAFYNQGAWSGDYWVWHDRDGHVHREARAIHEQRAARINGGGEHHEEEHH